MQCKKFYINQITLALVIAFGASSVQAVGKGEIVNGSGSISTDSGSTVVNQQSRRMIIDWNNMDIGKNESMQFNQPRRDAAVLNRINANNPTLIQGALNANGQVFIVNPNGVLISKGATVNVGSLVASSLDIRDRDFMQGKLKFAGRGKGSVINEGDINTTGSVALIGGGKVSNTGTIRVEADGEGVALASGETITLEFPYRDSIRAKIDRGSLKALVENGGIIVTSEGNIVLTAWATDRITRSVVNNTGTLEAATAVYSRDTHGVYLGNEGNGRVDVSGNIRGYDIFVKGDSISVKNDAVLASNDRFSTTFKSTGRNGNVRLAKSQLYGNINVIADNVLVGGADDKPTFVNPGDINIIATSRNTTVGNKSINNTNQIESGKGVISKDLVDAFREQELQLNIHADNGDLNLDNANLDYGNMRLTSRRGDVNVKSKATGDALSIRSQGFTQAAGADITMAKLFSVEARNNVRQNGNIIADERIDIKSSSGNVYQAAGQTTAARYVRYRGKLLNLKGKVQGERVIIEDRKSSRRR